MGVQITPFQPTTSDKTLDVCILLKTASQIIIPIKYYNRLNFKKSQLFCLKLQRVH